MGQIQYMTIKDSKCCGGKETTFTIPIGATPLEIAQITGMSIERAIELYDNRISEDRDKCPVIYLSVAIIEQVQKNNCVNSVGTIETVQINSGLFSSQFSQKEADDKARKYFDSIKQNTANILGQCIENCNNCPPFRILRTTPCGEYRQNQECRFNQCLPYGSEYFVCTGNCRGENCVEECVTCSSLCITGECPSGYNCVNGVCIFDCTNQPCSNNCRNGSCVNGTCVDGKCVEETPPCITCSSLCANGQCPSGFNCINGVCVADCITCSSLCKNSPCLNPCDNCISGVCIPKSCPIGQQLDSNCNCIPIPCVPDCGEVRDETLDTDCKIGFRIQTCVNGNCVNSGTRFENKADETICSTGICRNGNCSSDCIPACPQATWVNSSACKETRTSTVCINANCESGSVEERNKPNGTVCDGSGSCLDGSCIQPPPEIILIITELVPVNRELQNNSTVSIGSEFANIQFINRSSNNLTMTQEFNFNNNNFIFGVNYNLNQPYIFGAGGGAGIEIRPNPAISGYRTGVLTITTNATNIGVNGVVTINLTGTA